MAAVGRTAFSNYILQTSSAPRSFTGTASVILETCRAPARFFIVFAIYAAQLVIAPLWLRHFQFGPLEWLWRSLTYGNASRFVYGCPARPGGEPGEGDLS